MTETQRRPTGLRAALTSWRVGSLALLSLSSGLPLGLVITAVPTWMARVGVDIKTIGVLTVAQAPYAFKFLWAPFMDRFHPPFLGRKRGWIAAMQVTLAAATALLAAQATSPTVGLVAGLTLLISFASASQDIAIDAYAVEVLKPEEHGMAVGARMAMYRAGMWISGNIAISLAPLWGWGWTLAALAVIYLLLLPVTIRAPEPAVAPAPPPTLRAALWDPFVGFLSRPQALEIAGLIVLYRLADNLVQALIRPFLVERGYSDFDIGIGSGAVVLFATLGGTFVGGAFTNRIGVARAMWVFGGVQMLASLGYALLAALPVNRPLLYAAMTLEASTSGMGMGALSVLLLRLTEKRFSATQYALLSSLFAIARTISGPPAGALAWAIGWRDFFLLTIPAAIPGLALLHRIAPWRTNALATDGLGRPAEELEIIEPGPPWPRALLWAWAMVAVAAGVAFGILTSGTLKGLRAMRTGAPFDLPGAVMTTLTPGRASEAIDLVASVVFGVLLGLAVAAGMAARGRRSTKEEGPAQGR